MGTIPFQVDELIASLNTSHIGNEAIELAKLQAQLKQALQSSYPQEGPFPTSPVQTANIHQGACPLNTPVSRTPSGPQWSHSSDMGFGNRRRSGSVVSVGSTRSRGRRLSVDVENYTMHDMEQDVMEEVEEEAEVDAFLYSNSATTPILFTNQSHMPSSSHACSPTTSAYALNDPFLAQLLHEQINRQPSFFAQLATAQQQNSPFYPIPQSQTQAPPFYPIPQSQTQPPTSDPTPYPAQMRPSQHPRPLTVDVNPHSNINR